MGIVYPKDTVLGAFCIQMIEGRLLISLSISEQVAGPEH